MTELDLDAIRARCDAATDGPWTAEYSEAQGNCVLPHDAESTREAVAVTRLFHQQADADFIAHARTDVPELIDEIERLQEAAERIPKLLFNEEQHALEIYNEGISGGRAADDPMMIHLNGRILGLQRARDIAARVLEGDSDD